jgi:hypothetical protein
MFFTLLYVLLGVSAAITIFVVLFFKKYITAILKNAYTLLNPHQRR